MLIVDPGHRDAGGAAGAAARAGGSRWRCGTSRPSNPWATITSQALIEVGALEPPEPGRSRHVRAGRAGRCSQELLERCRVRRRPGRAGRARPRLRQLRGVLVRDASTSRRWSAGRWSRCPPSAERRSRTGSASWPSRSRTATAVLCCLGARWRPAPAPDRVARAGGDFGPSGPTKKILHAETSLAEWLASRGSSATIAGHESQILDPAGGRGDADRPRLRFRLLPAHDHARGVAELDRGAGRVERRAARCGERTVDRPAARHRPRRRRSLRRARQASARPRRRAPARPRRRRSPTAPQHDRARARAPARARAAGLPRPARRHADVDRGPRRDLDRRDRRRQRPRRRRASCPGRAQADACSACRRARRRPASVAPRTVPRARSSSSSTRVDAPSPVSTTTCGPTGGAADPAGRRDRPRARRPTRRTRPPSG